MPTPRDQIVLLGASNLAIERRLVVDLALSADTAPQRVLIACGHGRSYGQWSRVLWRGLPGISACGLWAALDRDAPTRALITDVGNDIVYGVDVATILGWLEGCCERLAGASMIVTGLPAASIDELDVGRFRIMRTLFFPTSSVSLAHVRTTVHVVNDALRAIAERFGATFVAPQASWFGFDPIHYSRRDRAAIWSRLLASWGVSPGAVRNRWSGQPAARRIWGRDRTSRQPCATLPNGSTVSMF